MPRKPRIEYAGAIYHVMSRGDRQEAVYRDSSDCEAFLETLGQACERTGWIVHCFALMGNHYHCLVETPEPNLAVGMKWLQSTYTQRFNRRHREGGHLFQGRYKALPIDPDAGEYFKVVSNYIHLNPARAKRLRLKEGDLLSYPWSSYPSYVHTRKRLGWLRTARVLECFALSDDRSGRSQYRRKMQAYAAEVAGYKKPREFDPDWSKIRRGWFLGSKQFGETLLDKLEGVRSSTKKASLSGPEIRRHDERRAAQMKVQGLKALGLSETDLAALPKGATEKKVLAWFIKRQTVVSNAWLSEQLLCGHPANVPGYVKAVREKRDKQIRNLVRAVEKK